jgi:NAD(P)-dependent dehydrogenase (short-subunit alcohol dehydrogenase family)
MAQTGSGSLEGRVAVVTGGGSGIGRASAAGLAADGAKVCVADLDEGAARSVAKEISEAGGEAFAIRADVTRPEDNARMVEVALERYGGLDIAHLNAGIAEGSTLLEGDVELWDRVMAVNLRGPLLGLSAVAKPMVAARRGSIIVTASVAGLRGGAGMPSYYASKHGVVGLVKAATAELSAYGVRVNAICPGVIDTPLLGEAHGSREILENIIGPTHPLGRVGEATEVANLVAFLASDRAAFMTGGAYTIDGGLSSSLGGMFGSSAAAEGSDESSLADIIQRLGDKG